MNSPSRPSVFDSLRRRPGRAPRYLLWTFQVVALVGQPGCQDRDHPEQATAVQSSASGRDELVAETSTVPQNETQPDSPAEARRERPQGLIPRFTMHGATSGLDFTRFDDISPLRRIQEVNGGGVALLDVDGDGLLEIFLTDGCRLPRSTEDQEFGSQLFGNQGSMQFKRITDAAQLHVAGFATGCAVGDFDSDGFPDLYVTAYGENSLWRNQGDGTFTPVVGHDELTVGAWSTSAAWHDVNGDGVLDLMIVNYLVAPDDPPQLCPNPRSPNGYSGCSPALFDGVDDVLLLGDGQGGFVDVTRDSGLAGLKGKGLGVVIANFDEDPEPEIYVANDGQANFLFDQTSRLSDPADPASRSASKPVYAERALASGVALSESGFAQASMGVTTGDFDQDGRLDLFMTHFYGDTNTLYANRGGLLFESVTRSSRLGTPSRRYLGFGTEFWDPDNDGRLDLLVCNGHIDDRTWNTADELYRMPAQQFRNSGAGQFDDVSRWCGEYFQQAWLGRGLAIGDLNRDGRIDAVISHQLEPSIALENQTEAAGKSLVLRFIGRDSNRDGRGVRVVAEMGDTQIVRECSGGGSFQSSSGLELHLGMGDLAEVNLTVFWPAGAVQRLESLSAGTWGLLEPTRKPDEFRSKIFQLYTEKIR